MIEAHFAPGDEVGLFACTLHGRLRLGSAPAILMGTHTHELTPPMYPASLLERLGNAFSPYTQSVPADVWWARFNTHLLQVPGIGPLDMAPEELEAEQAAGRAWQNYALISGPNQVLFGHVLSGWVCIDPAGKRWAITPVGSPALHFGTANISEALAIDLDVRPFGELDQPAALPVRVGAVLADIGQEDSAALSSDPLVRLVLMGISSNGRQVLIGIFPQVNYPAPGTDQQLPAGWLKLTLLGNGPDFDLQAEVLYSRADCMGSTTQASTNTIKYYWLDFDLDYSVSGESGHRTVVGTPTGDFELIEHATPPTTCYYIGTESLVNTTIGRILNVAFDDSDQLIITSADIEFDAALHLQMPTVSVSGELSATEPELNNVLGSVSYNISQVGTDIAHHRITIRRGATPIEVVEWRNDQGLSFTAAGVILDSGSLLSVSAQLDPPWIGPVDAKGYAGLSSISTARSYRFEIDGVERFAWDAPVRGYAKRAFVSPALADRGVVGFSVELAGTGRPIRSLFFRIYTASNHGVWTFWRTAVENLSVNFRKWQRLIATQAEWSAISTSSDPETQPPGVAYHPKTHELVPGNAPGEAISHFI